MGQLEEFIAGKPLNERMGRLMRGEVDDDEAAEETAALERRNYADGTPVTDADRAHLRRLMASAGWQVLLKLLDTELKHQEDAARRMSLIRSAAKEEKLAAWETVAANREARNAVEALAEAEVAKLKGKKRS